ncbi:uncharacterized protein isoform X2 [Rhodnius prolixus]|uniref:uncharacterized protein isoform X2 n=1 Tax=Rhodnius prolixus TaxID=13249 RepID=UPI003D18A8C5
MFASEWRVVMFTRKVIVTARATWCQWGVYYLQPPGTGLLNDCRYDGGQLLIGDIWRCDQRRAMLSEVTLLFWRSVGQLLQSLSPPPWSSS